MNKINLAEVRKFGNLELLARQQVEGFITGLHKSPYHGFSVEFAEHKIYNPGEGTRYIDWKLFAKTDRLYTKRFEEETNLRCQILIDCSSSMYYPLPNYGKITFSILAAASLSYMLHKQRDAVGITTFDEEVLFQSPIKSSGSHLNKLLIMLEQLNAKKAPLGASSSIAPLLHQIADQMNRRSLIILFSDLLDSNESEEEIFSALQHLKHNKHEVILFHTIDSKTEKELQLSDVPYLITDLETGEKLKLKPQEVRDAYYKQLSERRNRIKLTCGAYKIDFIEADIDKGIDQILTPYLVTRKKMV